MRTVKVKPDAKARGEVEVKKVEVKSEVEPKAKSDKLPAKTGIGKGKNDERKIHLLVKGNPKREGSNQWRKFNLYKEGMTVRQAVEAGVTRWDVRDDLVHKRISLK